MDKQIKKIRKLYKKILSNYNKFFYEKDNTINYFLAYLMYLLDMAIIITPTKDYKTDVNISMLVYAIDEFHESQNCIYKYYDINNSALVCRHNQEEDQANYAKEKIEHLNNFLSIVRDNLNEWIDLYGGEI